MKTAEDYIEQMKNSINYWEFGNEFRLHPTEIKKVMKAYAQQVAEKALKDASERTSNFNNFVSVEMILSTPITTP